MSCKAAVRLAVHHAVYDDNVWTPALPTYKLRLGIISTEPDPDPLPLDGPRTALYVAPCDVRVMCEYFKR